MDVLERYRGEIVRALAAALPDDGPLARLVRYPLGLCEADGRPGPGIRGKLLRPTLTCFACDALGGVVEAAVPLAVAIELVHVFSLVHDDIQDGDELRRGRPAAWVALGLSQAINAGDALLALALRSACRADLSAREVVLAQSALIEATRAMIEGQVLDLDLEAKLVGTEAYLGMAHRKTGALLGCSLELGAIAALRPDLAGEHRKLGENLGVAFQVRDDWLGLWGDPGETGKAVGADLARGKRSFPIAWALERDPSLAPLLHSGTPDEVQARLAELGASEATADQAERLLGGVSAQAERLPWSEWAKQEFADLCRGLAARVR